MVSEDGHALDVSRMDANLVGDLSEGSVVVEPGHGSEVLSGDIFDVMGQNEAVRVAGISNHNSLDVPAGVFLKWNLDVH